MKRHISEDDVTEYRIGEFCTCASDLGWPIGEFPMNLTTSLGNTHNFVQRRCTPRAVYYEQVAGPLTLTVFND